MKEFVLSQNLIMLLVLHERDIVENQDTILHSFPQSHQLLVVATSLSLIHRLKRVLSKQIARM